MTTTPTFAETEARLRAKVKSSRGLGLQTVAVTLVEIEALLEQPPAQAGPALPAMDSAEFAAWYATLTKPQRDIALNWTLSLFHSLDDAADLTIAQARHALRTACETAEWGPWPRFVDELHAAIAARKAQA